MAATIPFFQAPSLSIQNTTHRTRRHFNLMPNLGTCRCSVVIRCSSSNAREQDSVDKDKEVKTVEEDKRRAELSARIASGEFTVQRSGFISLLRNGLSKFGAPSSMLEFLSQWTDPREDYPKIPEAKGAIRAIRSEAFFIPLYELYLTYGGIFRLTFGPKSFLIVSDPSIAKHILRDNSKSYSKGILAEILEFVMGTGLIPADGETWRVRRRAIVPALHQKRMVEEEELQFHEDYMNEQDPSILHFLLASGDDVSSKQLRDDLMTMLIAGHETSAAVLTWTFYLLSQEPSVVCKLQNEVDSVLGDRFPTIEDMKKLKYTTRVINESLRLYPQPPVLIRRSLEDDILGKYPIKRGEDIFISIWNLHRCPKHWEDADKFNPERWPLDGPNPNETNQNFSYLPFGGGPRKCVGDMFASYETVVAVAMLVQRFNFEMALEAPRVEMTTGATIHTTKGLKMRVTRRIKQPIMPELEMPVLNVNSVGLSEVEPELAQRGEVSAANS